MPATYPTDSDLEALLSGMGITVTDALRALLPDEVDAAWRAFEEDTCRRPFLAATGATTRRFDPPTRHCDGVSTLQLTGLLPEDGITVIYQPTGSSAITLVEGEDYAFGPANAADEGLPYEEIDFYGRRWSEPLAPALRRSLSVTGRWGYSATVPQDAWSAIRGRAFYGIFPVVRQLVTGGKLSEREGDVEITYGIENWSQLLISLVGKPEEGGRGGKYGEVVRNYRKVSL